jgi:hypothetical protein
MDKIIAFSNKTEARDQFTKSIQYISKLLAWCFIDIDKLYQKRFTDLFSKIFTLTIDMTQDARKFFRLFKSLQELKNINDKIKDLLWKKDKIPILLEIISRLGFLVKWVFDNLYILAMINLIQSNGGTSKFAYYSNVGFLFGLLWGIVKNLYEILNTLGKRDLKECLRNLIELVGKLGDLIPASNGVGLSKRLLGYQFNDGLVGLGGAVSALASMWSLWDMF